MVHLQVCWVLEYWVLTIFLFLLPAAAAEPPSSSSDLQTQVAKLEAELKTLEDSKAIAAKVSANLLDDANKKAGQLRASYQKEKRMHWQTSLLLMKCAKSEVARMKATGLSLKEIAVAIKGIAAGDEKFVADMDCIINAANRANGKTELEAAREEVELIANHLAGGAPSCAQPNASIFAAAFKALFY